MPLFLIPNAANLTGDTLASNVVNASLNSITPAGGQLYVAGSITSGGNIIQVGAAGTGTGGNYRITDDGGTLRWLAGLLGTAGARDWTLLEVVSGRTPIRANASTGAVSIDHGLSVTGSISATGTAALRAINATSDYTALQMGTAATAYGQIGWGTGGEVVYNAAAGATRQHVFQVSGSNRLVVDANGAAVTGSISATTRVNYPSFTVATLPAVGSAGGNIYVSDESGGAQPAFSDGTNWRRYTDRAVVS